MEGPFALIILHHNSLSLLIYFMLRNRIVLPLKLHEMPLKFTWSDLSLFYGVSLCSGK